MDVPQKVRWLGLGFLPFIVLPTLPPSIRQGDEVAILLWIAASLFCLDALFHLFLLLRGSSSSSNNSNSSSKSDKGTGKLCWIIAIDALGAALLFSQIPGAASLCFVRATFVALWSRRIQAKLNSLGIVAIVQSSACVMMVFISLTLTAAVLWEELFGSKNTSVGRAFLAVASTVFGSWDGEVSWQILTCSGADRTFRTALGIVLIFIYLFCVRILLAATLVGVGVAGSLDWRKSVASERLHQYYQQNQQNQQQYVPFAGGNNNNATNGGTNGVNNNNNNSNSNNNNSSNIFNYGSSFAANNPSTNGASANGNGNNNSTSNNNPHGIRLNTSLVNISNMQKTSSQKIAPTPAGRTPRGAGTASEEMDRLAESARSHSLRLQRTADMAAAAAGLQRKWARKRATDRPQPPQNSALNVLDRVEGLMQQVILSPPFGLFSIGCLLATVALVVVRLDCTVDDDCSLEPGEYTLGALLLLEVTIRLFSCTRHPLNFVVKRGGSWWSAIQWLNCIDLIVAVAYNAGARSTAVVRLTPHLARFIDNLYRWYGSGSSSSWARIGAVACVKALPEMAWVVGVWAVITCVFAFIGIDIFADRYPCNFSDFGVALTTLVRAAFFNGSNQNWSQSCTLCSAGMNGDWQSGVYLTFYLVVVILCVLSCIFNVLCVSVFEARNAASSCEISELRPMVELQLSRFGGEFKVIDNLINLADAQSLAWEEATKALFIRDTQIYSTLLTPSHAVVSTDTPRGVINNNGNNNSKINNSGASTPIGNGGLAIAASGTHTPPNISSNGNPNGNNNNNTNNNNNNNNNNAMNGNYNTSNNSVNYPNIMGFSYANNNGHLLPQTEASHMPRGVPRSDDVVVADVGYWRRMTPRPINDISWSEMSGISPPTRNRSRATPVLLRQLNGNNNDNNSHVDPNVEMAAASGGVSATANLEYIPGSIPLFPAATPETQPQLFEMNEPLQQQQQQQVAMADNPHQSPNSVHSEESWPEVTLAPHDPRCPWRLRGEEGFVYSFRETKAGPSIML